MNLSTRFNRAEMEVCPFFIFENSGMIILRITNLLRIYEYNKFVKKYYAQSQNRESFLSNGGTIYDERRPIPAESL